MKRWENALTHRYYEIRVMQDLFGRWEVLRTWGRIGAALGTTMREQVSDEAAIGQAVEAVTKKRVQRGYLPVQVPV